MTPETIDRSQAVEVIRELAQRYVAKHERPPRTIIVVGGTALAMRGLRDQSSDIDIFQDEDAFAEVARELETMSGHKIDVTNDYRLWGGLDVYDIESDAEVMETLDVEGFSVDIAAISVETLFVIKASSMRDKDRADLPAIMAATTPERIMERTQSLVLALDDRYLEEEVLGCVISEIQLVVLDLVQPGWFATTPELSKRHGKFLKDEFALNTKAPSGQLVPRL